LIFKELDAVQTVVCCVALLSAQKGDYGLLLKPCQAVDFLAFVSLAAYRLLFPALFALNSKADL
jgi:hypothetical protein